MKNVLIKVLSVVMALTMVMGAFGTLAVFAADCTHENRTQIGDPVAPTCKSVGYTNYKCEDCGEEFIDSIVPKLADHTWVETPATDAACGVAGKTAGLTCSVCGETTVKNDPAKPALSHVWHIAYEKEATCFEDGFKTMKCARCGAIDTENESGKYEETAKAAHKFVYTVITEATACLNGSYQVTCENCDYSKIITDSDKQHTPVTVTASGTEVELADEGKVFVGEYCGAKYKKLVYCSVCKVKLEGTEANTNMGHPAAKVTFVSGNSEGKLDYSNINQKIVNEAGLNIGDYVSVEVNCCISDGYDLKYCSECDTYFKDIVEKLDDHKWYTDRVVGTVNATTDPAYDHTLPTYTYTVCKSGCVDENGERIQKVLEVLVEGVPHDFTHDRLNQDGTVAEKCRQTTEATCTTNGFTMVHCTIAGCDEHYLDESSVVYALDHDWSEWDWDLDVNANGCAGGENAMVRVCERENCPLKSGDVPHSEKKASTRTEHEYEDVLTAATCVENAYKTKICKHCGHNGGLSDADKQPAAGTNAANHVIKDMVLAYASNAHTVASKVVNTPTALALTQVATCAQEERWNFACVCGAMVNVKTANKLEHDWDDTGVKVTIDPDMSNPANWTGTFGSMTYSDPEADNAVTKDAREIPSTCKTLGQNKGKVCTLCGEYEVAPTPKTQLNPSNHEGDGTKVGNDVPATCDSKVMENIYFSCCGAIIPTIKADDDNGTPADDTDDFVNAVNPNNHVKAVKTNAVAATCTTEGMNAYYFCSGCNKYMAVSGDSYDASTATIDINELELTIPMLSDKNDRTKGQHNWNTAINAVAEQCTVAGSKAYQTCKDCLAWLVDGVVVFDDPATTGDGKNEQLNAIYVAPHGSAHMAILSSMNKMPTCYEDGYLNIPADRVCSKCGTDGSEDPATARNFDAEFKVAKLNHEYKIIKEVIDGEETGKLLRVADSSLKQELKTFAGDCTKPSYVVNYCTACDYQFVTGFDKATHTAHDYTTDDGKLDAALKIRTIPASCTAAGYDVYKCANAGCNVEHKEKIADVLPHQYLFNDVKVDMSFDCTDYDEFKGLTCVNGCGKTVQLGVYETVGNAKVLVEKSTLQHVGYKHSVKEATCTEGGWDLHICTACSIFNPADYDLPADRTTDALGHDMENAVVIEKDETHEILSCPRCQEQFTTYYTILNTTTELDNTTIAAGSAVTVTIKATASALAFNQLVIEIPQIAAWVIDSELVYDFTDGNAHMDVNKAGYLTIYAENDVNNEKVYVTLDGEDVVLATLTIQVPASVNGTFPLFVSADGILQEGKEAFTELTDKGAYSEITIVTAGDLSGDNFIGISDVQALIPTIVGGEYDALADVNKDGEVDQFDVAALRKFINEGKTAAAYLEMVGEDIDAAIEAVKAPDMNKDGYSNANDEILFANAVKAVAEEFSYADYLDLCNRISADSFVDVVSKIAAEIADPDDEVILNGSTISIKVTVESGYAYKNIKF